jgi:hypothetical protein
LPKLCGSSAGPRRIHCGFFPRIVRNTATNYSRITEISRP